MATLKIKSERTMLSDIKTYKAIVLKVVMKVQA